MKKASKAIAFAMASAMAVSMAAVFHGVQDVKGQM